MNDRDPLKTYREKRNPGATNEPFERVVADATPTWVGDFVVHLHDATRRHYDLRLQIGGVLMSFAVPKGPSLDPVQKRLAVHTEDHPLAYLDFEDVIPEGSYGAGSMIVWDIGRVRYLEQAAEAGLDKGKLDFELQGHKLRGRFALVETTGRVKPPPKQRQWLLIKKQDRHCKPDAQGPVETEPWSVFSGLSVEELPHKERFAAALEEHVAALPKVSGWSFDTHTPMLCQLEGAQLLDAERLYELKLDGGRVWADKTDGVVRLRYRSGRAATASFPEVVRAVECLPLRNCLLDGEIVAFDERGKPSFQRMATRFGATRPVDVKRASIEVSVVFFVFDVLRIGDHDLTNLPLLQRKALVRQLVRGKGFIRYLDHLESDGRPLHQLCVAEGLEGVVSKRKTSKYRFGPERTDDWVKHKISREESFVIVGWVDGKGSREGFGALELGTYRGAQLVYRGRVGSGFDQNMLVTLGGRLRAIEAPTETAIEAPDEKARHWVRPVFGARVRFLEWTNEGRIRNAVFVALLGTEAELTAARAAPEREIFDLSVAGTTDAELDGEIQNDASVSPAPTATPAVLTPVRKVVLTNLKKVFWPDEGYTKGELLTYYEQISPWLLPQLRGRPVMLVRYPDGIHGKNFYQWNVPAGTPSWVRTLDLRVEERDGKDVTTFLLDDVDALLHIINLGCIPIHVLACREDSLEECDFMTIDFDLGEQPLQTAVMLALTLRELLEELGFTGYPKTSGQSGLHVFIPLPPKVPFAAAKALLELLGRFLQTRHSDVATMERRINQRGGRVYIDTGQTGRSRTIVAPYSVRAYPGARVSTPLYWEEVHLALRPERYTMFGVPNLVQERGDPLADWGEKPADIARAIERLGRWAQG